MNSRSLRQALGGSLRRSVSRPRIRACAIEREFRVFATSAASAQQTTPTAIVFEKQPRWAPELQRQFLTEDVRVIACRSVRDVEERAAGVARGVILLDASMAPAECLQFLRRAMADPQALPVLIVGTKRIAHLEWSFRELGAAAFFAKRIPGHEMASLCRRQWSRQSASRSERFASSHQHQGSSPP
jgi:DNA-binding NtrC family response regulator